MGTIDHLEGLEKWTGATMSCLAVDDLDVDRDTEATPYLPMAMGCTGTATARVESSSGAWWGRCLGAWGVVVDQGP